MDLIPRTYDTDRIIRVRGVDGAENFVPINHTVMDDAGQATIINDITVGKYDVHIDSGPGYATQRLEFLDGMGQIMQFIPEPMRAVIAPKLIANMDWHGAQDIADELKPFIPQAPPTAPPGMPLGGMPPGMPGGMPPEMMPPPGMMPPQ